MTAVIFLCDQFSLLCFQLSSVTLVTSHWTGPGAIWPVTCRCQRLQLRCFLFTLNELSCGSLVLKAPQALFISLHCLSFDIASPASTACFCTKKHGSYMLHDSWWWLHWRQTSASNMRVICQTQGSVPHKNNWSIHGLHLRNYCHIWQKGGQKCYVVETRLHRHSDQ